MIMLKLFFLLSILLLCFVIPFRGALRSPWRYECIQGYCQKKPITNETENTALSLPVCRLFCSDAAAIWPKPTGNVSIGNLLATININSIDVLGSKYESNSHDLVNGAIFIFKKQITDLIPISLFPRSGKSLVITLNIQDPDIDSLTLDLDESYVLNINESTDGRIQAVITGSNFFGVRHGLETLNQLIVYDDLRNEVQIARDVTITDKPTYKYRGVLVDTSRNYITVEGLKNTLNAMGAAKLNTLHWHITDSHSFPYVSKSHPELSYYGAYSPDKVYTPEAVQELIQYGKERGVRILPEFDAPAHVGEGWQGTDLVTCFNWQPWQSYCVEPPCGQFDVTKPKLYDILEDLYGDLLEQFQPDIFHMGGDEINFNCWNSTDSIINWMTEQGLSRNHSAFIQLWNYFQNQALERLYKKANRTIPVIMWTSGLTDKEYLINSLPKDKYIIQIWTLGSDETVANLLDNGYSVILSNYDALYLDCGFAGWVQGGNNWCSPYIGWQKVYENTPSSIAAGRENLVLGAESTLWTEQADVTSLDSRLWPRASAMAEVLWTNPTTTWRDAESRFLIHRERLVKLGVNADAIEPEWCMQYEENCPTDGKFNKSKRRN